MTPFAFAANSERSDERNTQECLGKSTEPYNTWTVNREVLSHESVTAPKVNITPRDPLLILSDIEHDTEAIRIAQMSAYFFAKVNKPSTR